MIWLSLIGLSLLILNNSMFLHVHKLENGKIITHAHPFDKSEKSPEGAAKHKHTQQELFIFHILNSFLILGISLFVIKIVFKLLNKIKSNYYKHFHTSLSFQTFKIRPPPTFC